MIEGDRIIDFHAHACRSDPIGMKNDPELMLRAMDRAGIDLTCLNSIYHPDGTIANDLTARFVRQHPDRFLGFAYVSPVMPDRVIPELGRAIGELGFSGIPSV